MKFYLLKYDMFTCTSFSLCYSAMAHFKLQARLTRTFVQLIRLNDVTHTQVSSLTNIGSVTALSSRDHCIQVTGFGECVSCVMHDAGEVVFLAKGVNLG